MSSYQYNEVTSAAVFGAIAKINNGETEVCSIYWNMNYRRFFNEGNGFSLACINENETAMGD